MATLTIERKQGSTYNVILNGVYPITTIRRKYETWLVPSGSQLLEVNNLNEVGKHIVGNDVAVKLVR